MSHLLIIGLGNADCGDDGVGRLVARLLCGMRSATVQVEEQDGNAASLIERLREAESVFLIDAAVTGAPPGTLHTIDCTVESAALPAGCATSSHGLGVADAIAMARLLNSLPRVCILYAVEGAAFAPGAPMSPAVRDAAEALAAHLAREILTRTL